MRTCIVGVGNELCTDDAVGMEIVKRLQSSNLANGLEIYPVGGDLLTIPVILAKYKMAFIIDALPPGREPGKLEISEYYPEKRPNCGHLSLHDVNLFNCLQYAFGSGFGGRIILIGVETASVEPGYGLSDRMLDELDGIVRGIAERIGGLMNPEEEIVRTDRKF